MVWARVINETGWTSGAGGALIGLYATLGFTATAFFSQVLFVGRPPRLYAIDAGYQVFQAVVMGRSSGSSAAEDSARTPCPALRDFPRETSPLLARVR